VRLVAAVICAAGVAAADEPDAARVDWAAGRVTAGGVGIADRHAPSPAVALGTSRRGAEQAAKQRIAARLPGLALASGGTLASKLGDPAIQARVDAAVEAAITVDAEPDTDGSWHVTLAVPIEAIRQAIAGPRALAGADAGPPVIVVEAAAGKPAIGWTVGGVGAATLWVKDVPAWAKDAPRVQATAKGGDLALAGRSGAASTLYVIVAR
jgi:hypothetical protein